MTVASSMAWAEATNPSFHAEINWMEQTNPLAYHTLMWAEATNNAGLAAAVLDPPSSGGNGGPFGFSNAADALGITGSALGLGYGAYSGGIFGAVLGGFALGAAIANAIGNGNLGVDSVGEAASYGGGF